MDFEKFFGVTERIIDALERGILGFWRRDKKSIYHFALKGARETICGKLAPCREIGSNESDEPIWCQRLPTDRFAVFCTNCLNKAADRINEELSEEC